MKSTGSVTDVLDRMCDLSKAIIDGASLEGVLDQIFTTFATVLPFERIGYAKIDVDRKTATAHWMKSEFPAFLTRGYSAPLAESSLSTVIERGVPRVMNDLPRYLARKPHSESTRLIVREGFKSSLTCREWTTNRISVLQFHQEGCLQ